MSKVKKVKEPKPPKKMVDKSDPNWKLKPNDKVTIMLKVKTFMKFLTS